MPNQEVLRLKSTCDIIIDQVGNHGGWGYGMNSVESMALGLCCMTEMNPECHNFYKNHPFISIDTNTIEEKLIELINSPNTIDKYKQRALSWALDKHDVKSTGKKLYEYYSQLL